MECGSRFSNIFLSHCLPGLAPHCSSDFSFFFFCFLCNARLFLLFFYPCYKSRCCFKPTLLLKKTLNQQSRAISRSYLLLSKTQFLSLIKPENSVPSSEEPATGCYESISHSHILLFKKHFNIMLLSLKNNLRTRCL
jgi:hypothetical protein